MPFRDPPRGAQIVPLYGGTGEQTLVSVCCGGTDEQRLVSGCCGGTCEHRLVSGCCGGTDEPTLLLITFCEHVSSPNFEKWIHDQSAISKLRFQCRRVAAIRGVCVSRARVRVSLLGVFVCVWVGFWLVLLLLACTRAALQLTIGPQPHVPHPHPKT